VLSSGRGYWFKIVLYLAAYVVPAAVVWGLLGLALGWLHDIPLLLPLLGSGYALWFGIAETLEFPFWPLEIRWQVPSKWIRGRPLAVQTLTWGTILGPGLVTRNPYAGMWLLPLLLGLNRGLLSAMIVGIAIGATHGAARVLGVLSNRRSMEADINAHLRIMAAQARWQYADGRALLLAAGALAAYTLSLLGAHL
jgi:hypothetical protein